MTKTRSDRGQGVVTLDDVARAAGVSVATASRVLNGSTRRVAEPYRSRVEAAASGLGYTANAAAQATARGSSGTIALLVGDIADPYFSQLAAGVARGADAEGMVLTISITGRDSAREARILRALRGQRPRGVILAASRSLSESDAVARELAELQKTGTQIVALGPGLEKARTVPIDNHGGAWALGKAMGGRGYRRAVALAAPAGVYTSDERVDGFTRGFAAAGGVVEQVLRGGFDRHSGELLMRAALADGVEPGTVVFAISDAIALGAHAVLRRAGRVPGDDVALAGYDDIPSSQDVDPGLTTVRVPLTDIGFEAFSAAAATEWRPRLSPTPVEVVIRASTPGLER